MARSRDPNLDWLRAAAILMVLAYHGVGMWPTEYPLLRTLTGVGKYGVTLFFVLSGWLIGGIYWREQGTHGSVQLKRFWLRRWIRTVPPYYCGVVLGFLAVAFTRSQPFDISYAFFLQNYAYAMPFYLISWSLCVEEHFYLALPLLGACIRRMPVPLTLIALWTLPLLCPVLRVLDGNVDYRAPFGYSHTATHLVFEGLALGVAAAYTNQHVPALWPTLQRVARWFILPTTAVFLSIPWWSKAAVLYVGQSAIAMIFLVWLTAVAGARLLPLARSRLVYGIAITSYSVYLTHSLAIHAGRLLAPSNGSLISELTCGVVWIAIISLSGLTVYALVERLSLRLRDRLAGNLSRQVSAVSTGD